MLLKKVQVLLEQVVVQELAYDFDAVDPIQVNTTPGVGANPTRVVTSLDIQSLGSRV